MSRRRSRATRCLRLWAAVLASGLGTALPVAAQSPLPAGAQFQVNTYTTEGQVAPSVSIDGNGSFVVVWTSIGSFGSDTDAFSIQGQRYSTSGASLGAEFQVNTYTTSVQGNASVATESDGDFVVVWESRGSSGTDTGGNYSIQGQRYASSGFALGAQFQVNTNTTNNQERPVVGVDADGDFVVVWDSVYLADVLGQRYASSGSPLGVEFQLGTYTASFQYGPSVATRPDGDFVVVWQSYGSSGTDTSPLSVQGQRYASSGATLGAQFQVNT